MGAEGSSVICAPSASALLVLISRLVWATACAVTPPVISAVAVRSTYQLAPYSPPSTWCSPPNTAIVSINDTPPSSHAATEATTMPHAGRPTTLPSLSLYTVTAVRREAMRQVRVQAMRKIRKRSRMTGKYRGWGMGSEESLEEMRNQGVREAWLEVKQGRS